MFPDRRGLPRAENCAEGDPDMCMKRLACIILAFALLISSAAADNGRSADELMNVLVCGLIRDEDGTRAGLIMVLSANTRRGGVRLAFINGDLVAADGEKTDRLSALYDAVGPDGMAAVLSGILDTRIRRYVTVDMNGFCTAVDAFGGVEITLDEEEAAAVSAVCGEEVLPGAATLNGSQAFAYVRLRGGDQAPGNDRKRVFLSAMVEKTLRSPDIGTLLSVADQLLPNIETSLTLSDMMSIAIAYLAGWSGRLETCSIPAPGEYTAAEGEQGGIVLKDEHAAAESFWQFVQPNP